MKELRFHGEKIITGEGAINYLEKIQCKRVFVVTGKSAMFKNGTIQKIEDILGKKDCVVEIHSGIPANPTTLDVLEGLEKMNVFQPETIIAVGGGSAIDAAKVMTLLYDDQQLSLEGIQEMTLPSKRTKTQLIAIPSTSGTATEVTWSAVVTFKKEDIKIGLKSPAFVPDIAILDGSLTLTMPKNVVAETGMDAMTHAVESYINKNSDDFTGVLAKGAVEGLYKFLPHSYKDGDQRSRQKVHNYQCMAGCAFTNVGLGMAHGISHAIGGMYNLGHGLINAVALPYVLEYNAQDPEVKQRLGELGKSIQREDFIQAIRELNTTLNIPRSFKELGISQEDFQKDFSILVDNGLKGSTRSNPITVPKEDMEKILKRIYHGE
ncbi:iron-containing alcohol dehydrogenase [Irregularibacter muris]|uniref:Iron-containing alcohol dehydrogenase n=1 Tax=Irregularibacter muris TaxID=1796619 RepID=A0AAE3HIC9_9FIRM|nr:iron-containing alcohol dehydrogenase [Irregularibacter muris]MCR1899479.1 iron-containing alcohol dehydrogenase [Irregularibacter muris]